MNCRLDLLLCRKPLPCRRESANVNQPRHLHDLHARVSFLRPLTRTEPWSTQYSPPDAAQQLTRPCENSRRKEPSAGEFEHLAFSETKGTAMARNEKESSAHARASTTLVQGAFHLSRHRSVLSGTERSGVKSKERFLHGERPSTAAPPRPAAPPGGRLPPCPPPPTAP